MTLDNVKPGDRFNIGRARYTAMKVEDGRILCKGQGFKKWISIAELEKKGAVLQEGEEC